MPKGQKFGGRQKGAKNEKTLLWEEMGDYIASYGADKYLQYLMSLEGENFAKRFEAILEWFKPKLSRAVDKHGEDAQSQTIILSYANKPHSLAAGVQPTLPEGKV